VALSLIKFIGRIYFVKFESKNTYKNDNFAELLIIINGKKENNRFRRLTYPYY
jgi:hypothetical protein